MLYVRTVEVKNVILPYEPHTRSESTNQLSDIGITIDLMSSS
jgi:hypothetical protein